MKKSILIVETDHEIRVEARRTLEDSDYVVFSFTNGPEALATLPRISLPAAILLSRNMRMMDASDFIKTLKSLPKFSKIPVIHLKNQGEEDLQGSRCEVIRSEISRSLVKQFEKCLGGCGILPEEGVGGFMNNKEKLSDFLKSKRVAAGLTQRDVSNALGYSTPQFVSNWERGISQPPIETLVRVSKIIKADEHELFALVLELTIFEVTDDLKRKFKKRK